jgi:N6-adenosine-specific RNA methylase IME4
MEKKVQITVDSEFKELIPPLSFEEFTQLAENIAKDGCRDPLVLWNGVLVDGHNRYDICNRLKLPFKTIENEFKDRSEVIEWIIRNQFGRRNLSSYIRTTLALRLESEIAGRAKKNQARKPADFVKQNSAEQTETRKELAKLAGVSHNTVDKVKKIELVASPKTKEALAKGEISINQAHNEIKTKERREERVKKIVEISKGNSSLEQIAQFYPVIYVDPPWRYDYSETEGRAIENQYPTMSLDEIKALDINTITTDDCVMFMWATSPKLAESLEVIAAWGFSYRTCAVWDKQKIGMGYYFRQQHELLLVAVKGSPPTPKPENRPSSVLSYPRGKHSAKPVEVYEIIEAMYPEMPKLEMFSRNPRAGWGSWGNQSA